MKFFDAKRAGNSANGSPLCKGLTGIIAMMAAILAFPGASFAQAPPVLWTRQLTSPYLDSLYFLDSALDKNSNFYLAGAFATTTFSVGGQTLTNASLEAGNEYFTQNAFVAKFDGSGNPLWVRQIGGSGLDINGNYGIDNIVACATDGAGDIYVTGETCSTNIMLGTNLLTSVSYEDFFLAKYDPQGNVLWVRQAYGNGQDIGTGVAVDVQGNVLVAGTSDSTNLMFGTNLVSNPNSTANSPLSADFVAKYTASGDLLWARSVQIGVYTGEELVSVGVDTNGNTYVCDAFFTNANFGVTNLGSSATQYGESLYLAKYDPQGGLLWAEEAAYSDGYFLYARKLAVDATGDTYVTGDYYPGSAVFPTATLPFGGGGENDVFVAKYDASGNSLWADISGGTLAGSISVDGVGNCYATAANGGLAAAKYSSGGNLLWSTNVALGSQFTGGSVDNSGTFYVFGGGTVYSAAKLEGPSLNINSFGNQVVVSWPTNDAGLNLETSTGLSGGIWSPVTNLSVLNSQFIVTNAATDSARFYRLRNF